MESRASTYRTTKGAHTSFALSAAGVTKARAFKRLSLGTTLGSEARFYLTTTTKNGVKVDVYAVFWRTSTVYAAVLGGGLSGTVDPSEVVRLAKKQQARIAEALSGLMKMLAHDPQVRTTPSSTNSVALAEAFGVDARDLMADPVECLHAVVAAFEEAPIRARAKVPGSGGLRDQADARVVKLPSRGRKKAG